MSRSDNDNNCSTITKSKRRQYLPKIHSMMAVKKDHKVMLAASRNVTAHIKAASGGHKEVGC